VKNLKKSIPMIRKSPMPMLVVLAFSIIMISVGTVSSIPTVNGTAIGVDNTVTVNINILDAQDISSWQAGLIFNPDLLECTGYEEGDFLSNVGSTSWVNATINNTLGEIKPRGSFFLGDYKASGDGRLGYLTFRVKAAGVSDLHLRDAKVVDYYFEEVPINLIDVYTVIVDTTSHTIVTVSNSSGYSYEYPIEYHSGLYNHAFNATLEDVSFCISGPASGFSSVKIPKTLLSVTTLAEWRVIIDDVPLSTGERTVTENATHTSIYFTYDSGIHEIHITTRSLETSTISIALSSTDIALESDVTISGDINPVRDNVTVTISYRPSGGTWTTLATKKTDSSSSYSYVWTPTETGTYQLKATWAGDQNTEGAESEVKTLTVTGAPEGIPLEYEEE